MTVTVTVTAIVAVSATQAKGSQARGMMAMMAARPNYLRLAIVTMGGVTRVALISAVAGVVTVINLMMTMANCVIGNVVNDVIKGEQRRAGRHQGEEYEGAG